MTHEFICKILETAEESPILLDNCVLNIREDRSTIYVLWGDTDYEIRKLEICYADNHSDVIFRGDVKTDDELGKIILDNLNL